MIILPNFDPVALTIGPLKVHWYGLMYLFGSLAAIALGKRLAQRVQHWHYIHSYIDDIFIYIFMTAIIFSRILSVLLYDFSYYMQDPIEILKIWHGGLSYHGGLIGGVLGTLYAAYKYQLPMIRTLDFIAINVQIGHVFGRMGNLINMELIGKPTNVAWGVVYPRVDQLVRHPAQIYHMLFDGLLVFCIMYYLAHKPRKTGFFTGLLLILYGFSRFCTEFFRIPDGQFNLIAFTISLGQLYSLITVLLGIIWFVVIYPYINGVKIADKPGSV